MFTRELSPQPRMLSQTCYDTAPSACLTCASKLSFFHPTPICSFLCGPLENGPLENGPLENGIYSHYWLLKIPWHIRQMWSLPSFSFIPIVKINFNKKQQILRLLEKVKYIEHIYMGHIIIRDGSVSSLIVPLTYYPQSSTKACN